MGIRMTVVPKKARVAKAAVTPTRTSCFICVFDVTFYSCAWEMIDGARRQFPGPQRGIKPQGGAYAADADLNHAGRQATPQ